MLSLNQDLMEGIAMHIVSRREAVGVSRTFAVFQDELVVGG